MLRVAKSFPTSLRIDGELLKFRIARLTQTEWTAFVAEFDRIAQVHNAEKLLLERKPGEEALKDEQVKTKRWGELTPAERERQLQEEREERERSDAYVAESITRYVKAEPGQIFDEDKGQHVVDGAHLLEIFGSRQEVLFDLVTEVLVQNRLSEEQKKNWRLLRAFPRGSEPSTAGAGETPEPTAASAEPSGSAPTAAATASADAMPSGTTA